MDQVGFYSALMFLIITRSVGIRTVNHLVSITCLLVCMRASNHPVDNVGIYNGVMHMIITECAGITCS